MNYTSLAAAAASAKENSLPIYSKFRVGAAILSSVGKIYKGGNIESSSYSLTICAERTALFKAISEGERKFTAIAITSDLDEFCPPCGACRQVLWDLCGNIDVILVKNNGEMLEKKLSDLLPLAFSDVTLNA